MSKVILILVDGMRPDAFLSAGNPYAEQLLGESTPCLTTRSVMPSVTLPCHMSLFHSVPPQRHGITTNTYFPMARPLNGLFEQLHLAGAVNAMYYGWEPLRDISQPKSLTYAEYLYARSEDDVDTQLTDSALARIAKSKPDFVFLYLVDTDEKGGHDNGWMSEEYLRRISVALDNVRRVVDACGEEYTIIVTADHGGHDRAHGTDMPEDMTIPMFFYGPDFEAGKELHGVHLLDLAPTIAKLLNVSASPEWEGTPLV